MSDLIAVARIVVGTEDGIDIPYSVNQRLR